MGSYWHASNKLFKPNDVVQLPSGNKLAYEIWEYDKRRKEMLEKIGITVLYYWEDFSNQDITNFYKQLNNLLCK